MSLPKQVKVKKDNTHRLIPHQYSSKPILNLLAQDDDDLLNNLTEIENATNDLSIGETGKLPGISALELVSGFDLAHIVNASFCYASEKGSRFNIAGRGAWYAGFEMQTSLEEVIFHRTTWLNEIPWKRDEVSPYIDYLADFSHEFHNIQGDADFEDCLDPDSYVVSQALGLKLLTSGSAGVVYPSVRHNGGTCIACFRPPLVQNVREGQKVTFTFRDARMVGFVIEG